MAEFVGFVVVCGFFFMIWMFEFLVNFIMSLAYFAAMMQLQEQQNKAVEQMRDANQLLLDAVRASNQT